MGTRTLTLELPEELIEIIGSPEAAAAKAREALVIELLRDATISQGQAARLLDLAADIPILLDDRAARRTARALGLHVYGSAGVLGLAKERGLIPAVRPVLDRLRAAGLYLSDRIYADILAQAQEEART